MLQANSNVGSSPEKISVHIGSSDRGTVGKRTSYSVRERESSSPGIMLEDILRDDEVSNARLTRNSAMSYHDPLPQPSSGIGITALDDVMMESPATQNAGALEKLNPFSYQDTNVVDNATLLREIYAISSRAESEEDDEAQFEGEEFDRRASAASAPIAHEQHAAAWNRVDTDDFDAFEKRRSLDKTKIFPALNEPRHALEARQTVKDSERPLPATEPTSIDVHGDSEREAFFPDDALTSLQGHEGQRQKQPQRLVESSKYFRSPPTVLQSASTDAKPELPAPKPASTLAPSSPKAHDIKERHTTAPSPTPAAEDDETLWRNFVFGSPSPPRDPILTFNPPPKPIQSSSPLLPVGTITHSRSSPPQQNQPSPLIAEASSSIHSQSNQQSNEPTSALAEYATSPIRTQHSMTAQPSLSADEPAVGASSPVRQQPPVIFTRPRPFVGEKSDASTGPFLRIGGAGGRRKRGADGRFLKVGKEDVGEGAGIVGDEIVD
ncbi:MAG: hypothetical protein Q9183_006467 [Haloplaca sp. 2 TL-2023]